MKLAIMRKLAGTAWGANEQILKTVYEGSVRPVLLQAEKYKCLPDHPINEKVEGNTNNIVKRSSFTRDVKTLQKDYPAVLTIPTLSLSKQYPCENTTSEI